ncbi:unnamed protein product [Adineta steineri]|uniref:Uncharacterized protein n=1 Tax=Adineta steineri TaxID=433720 RepID=A0A816DUS6_9BILA|nr:unnamed protein product [Adineta steineri]CAF1637616.1 unnamed protein product [Adineta steineri]
MIIDRGGNDNSGFVIDYNVTSSLCSIRKISEQQPLNNSANPIRQYAMMSDNNENIFDIKYKVLLLGDTLVGKTSLQRYIAGKDFRPNIGSTIGVDFVNKIIPVEKAKVNLQIWDTAGQKNFRSLGRSYYAATKAFVLVYDVTNEETFFLIEEFSRLIDQAGLDMERRYLVANKIDLIENRKIDEEQGRRFALRNSMTYFETSCKTGENVHDLFEQIASDLVRQFNPKILESHRPMKDNFAFNYHTSTISNYETRPTTTNNNNNQPIKQSRKPAKMYFSPSTYEAIENHKKFSFRRFIVCCNPRKTTATMD